MLFGCKCNIKTVIVLCRVYIVCNYSNLVDLFILYLASFIHCQELVDNSIDIYQKLIDEELIGVKSISIDMRFSSPYIYIFKIIC